MLYWPRTWHVPFLLFATPTDQQAVDAQHTNRVHSPGLLAVGMWCATFWRSWHSFHSAGAKDSAHWNVTSQSWDPNVRPGPRCLIDAWRWVNSPCAGIFNEICEKKTPVPVPVFLHVVPGGLGLNWHQFHLLSKFEKLQSFRSSFILIYFCEFSADCSRRFPSFSSLQSAPTPPLTFTWEQESLNEALPPLQELNELSPVSFTPQRGERWTMMNVRSWLEKFNEYQWIGFNLNLCSSTAYTPPKNAGEWRKMLSLRNTSWRQEHCILHSQILHLLLETADEGHWFCRSCRGAELDSDW